MHQKTLKKFFVSEIIACELVSLNSPCEKRYISSAANELTRSPKNLDVNKRDFNEHNFLASDQWIW